MPHTYQAFGLILQASRSIPGLSEPAHLPSQHFLEHGVVRIDLTGETPLDNVPTAPEPWYESPRDRHGYRLDVWHSSSDGSFLFSYSDDTRFLVDSGGSSIRASWPPTVTLEDVSTYLLGPVLGFVLRLRGVVCLHASGIAIADRCVGILAPGGHGKSTMAAVFARQGHPVATDDILAVKERVGGFQVEPAYPRLRLWPHSVAELFGDENALPRITPQHPTWDKRYLDLTAEGFSFQRQALPLAVLYKGVEDAEAEVPRIEAISGQDALLSLLANSYCSHLLDRHMRAREFEVLGRLVEAVPVRRFRVRRGVDQLDALGEAIASDCESL